MKSFIELAQWVKEEMKQEGYTLKGKYEKMCFRRELKSLY